MARRGLRAGDEILIGALYPRVIAVSIAAAFRRRIYPCFVHRYHERVHGIKPDTNRSAP